MTTDLGKDAARTSGAVPRQRGGAHAAAKTSRFRRKSDPTRSPLTAPMPSPGSAAPPPGSAAPPPGSAAPPPQVAPAPRPASGTVPWPREAVPPSSQQPQRPLQNLQSPQKPQSRDPQSPSSRGATRSGGQVTTPLLDIAAGGRAARAGEGLTRRWAFAARSATTNLCVMAIVAIVIPLVVVQIPDAIAWSLPPRLAAGGPAAVAGVLRASGLALPAMAVAGSLAALAVRRLRAGPVLLAGLLALAVADACGDAAHTIALVGADRTLHGAGAGIAMAGVVAVVTERQAQRQQQQRQQRQRQQEQPSPGPQNVARRLLAGWWAVFTVAGLALAPELMRHRVTSGGWHTALQPYPWLTGAALALTALYAMLAEQSAAATARSAFPAAERAQLALLTAPVAGICAIAIAVTYRGADAIALAGIAAITARAGTAARFAVICAVTGFTLAPAAGAVTSLTALTQLTVLPAGAVLAAALGGAALAALTRRPHARALTAVGLFLAAVGLASLDLAGLAAPSGRQLAVLSIPLAAGLTMALTASLRAAGAAGALAGVVIMMAGLVTGYLAAGAVQLHALTGARTLPALHIALVTAAGHLALLAASVAAVAALALACTKGRGRGGRAGPESVDSADGAPVPGAGATPIMGKLA